MTRMERELEVLSRALQLFLMLTLLVVLTKADQIKGENATKHWLDIFKSDQKEGKYFVTMLATSEDGTEEDEETILKKKPFSEHQPERKGVQTLTTAISVHLAEKIRNRFFALLYLSANP